MPEASLKPEVDSQEGLNVAQNNINFCKGGPSIVYLDFPSQRSLHLLQKLEVHYVCYKRDNNIMYVTNVIT